MKKLTTLALLVLLLSEIGLAQKKYTEESFAKMAVGLWELAYSREYGNWLDEADNARRNPIFMLIEEEGTAYLYTTYENGGADTLLKQPWRFDEERQACILVINSGDFGEEEIYLSNISKKRMDLASSQDLSSMMVFTPKGKTAKIDAPWSDLDIAQITEGSWQVDATFINGQPFQLSEPGEKVNYIFNTDGTATGGKPSKQNSFNWSMEGSTLVMRSLSDGSIQYWHLLDLDKEVFNYVIGFGPNEKATLEVRMSPAAK